jgi:hypothetical protein
MLTNKTYFGIIVKVGARRWQTKCKLQGLQGKCFTKVKAFAKMVLEN